jgi:hypothetical protein
MSENIQPIIGPGHFQWNAGSWFGSQIGGTAWLLIGAMFLLPESTLLSLIWLICFTLANVIGIAIWSRRAVIAPFKAIQLLMLVLGQMGLISWFLLVQLQPELVSSINGKTQMGYLALLIYPALMAWFYCLESGAKPIPPKGS